MFRHTRILRPPPCIRHPRVVPHPKETEKLAEQVMAKSRQVVKSKLNEWCDWRVDYVSKQVKSAVSKAFLRVKNNILNVYDGTKKTLTDVAEKETEKRKKQKNKKNRQ